MSIRALHRVLVISILSFSAIQVVAQDITWQSYDVKVLEGNIHDNTIDLSATLLNEIKTFDFISSSRAVKNQRSGGFQVRYEMFVSVDSVLSSDDVLFGSKTELISNFTDADLGYDFQIRCYDFPAADGEYFLLDKITLNSRNSSFEASDIKVSKFQFTNIKEPLVISGTVEPTGSIAPTGTDINATFTITNNSAETLNSYEWQFFVSEDEFDITSTWLNKITLKYPEMMEGEYPSQTTREAIGPGETKVIRNVPISVPETMRDGSFKIYALPLDAHPNWLEESNCIDLNPSPIIEVLGPTIGFEEDTLKIHSAPLQRGQANIILKNLGGGTLEWTMPRGCDFIEPIDRNGNIEAIQKMNAEVRITAPSADDICSVKINSNTAGRREVFYPIQFKIVDSMENVTLSVDDNSFCSDGKLSISFFRPPGITYFPDNKFYIELSEARGYFSLPKVLATSDGIDEKTIEITLPAGIDLSRDYAIRLRSTHPAYIGNPTPLKRVIGAGVINESNGVLSANSFSNATYQWLDCDNNFAIIQGATNPTFTPTRQSSYALVVSKSGCIDTTACYNYMMTSSVIEQADQLLSVAPNPTTHQFTVTHPSLPIEKIEILSLSGNVLKTLESTKNPMDISDLPSTIYFLKAITEDQILIKKIIKQ